MTYAQLLRDKGLNDLCTTPDGRGRKGLNDLGTLLMGERG